MIFIVYEIQHINEAKKRADSGDGIICLNFLLECECKRKNIPFTPLRNFVDAETGEGEWWKLSHDISREWYRLPSMDFFQYKGIKIGEVTEPIMQAHLAKIFYFVRIFLFLKQAFPEEHFFIPLPASASMSHECLASFQPWAILDAAHMCGIVKVSDYKRIVPEMYVFEREKLKHKIIKLYNFLISFAPKKSRKIYMSGYWTHAESLVPLLDNTELIILETKRFKDVPWKQLFNHRMRFMYSHDPVNSITEKNAKKLGDAYTDKWKIAKKDLDSYLKTLHEELNWSPIVDACDQIVNYSPRVIADIDVLFEIMKKEKPDIVLVMASVGGSHHYFFLMTSIARQLGIPSVELQHATVTSDPRSVFCRIEADCLLTYGESINAAHRGIGNGHKQLVSVGSPRFDQYVNQQDQGAKKGMELFKQLGLNVSRQTLLVPVPFSETYASAVDSYLLQEFFEAIVETQKNSPGLQIVFKCRTPKLVQVTKEYLEKLFYRDWVVTGDEDIFPFICASDVVLCNNSTVIYQAVLAKKPLVLYPWKRFDSYHAELYSPYIPLLYSKQAAIETLSRVLKDASYRAELLSKQKEFLREYMFDGRSSQRVADFLKNLAL